MRKHHTAGKGPGLVLRADNLSAAIRLVASVPNSRGLLEILETNGAQAEIGLSAGELKVLAKALLKVAAVLEAASMEEEVTQH
jgi:hypothetical protein